MELTPQAVAGAQFSSVRKGYDPDEVRAFLAKVARGIDSIQTAAGSADARAKTAEAEVIRLREESSAAPAAPIVTTTAPASEDTEQISRVLLLAQRTADAAVGEAQQEARSIVTAAEEKARTAVADAETRAAEVLAAARAEAREAGEVERTRVAAEVAALERRRAELGADVDRLGAEMAAGRERLIAVVESLRSVLDQPIANRRSPAGDGTPARPPLDAPRLTFEQPAPPPEGAALEGAALEGAALEGAAPEGAAPEGAAPEGAAPEGAADTTTPNDDTAAEQPAGAPESTPMSTPVEPEPMPAPLDAPEHPNLRAVVDDDVTGEFAPVAKSTRDELRDALADRFFDQGTFEDERWKPKA